MRGRLPGLGPALLVSVVATALALVVLTPGAGAQPPSTTDPSSSTTVVTTTTAPVASTTTVAATTTRAPTTTVVEEEEPAPTTTRRPTTTLRPTTTVRASTTTSSTSTTTSTTVAAAVVPSTTRPVTITSSTLEPDTASGNETRNEIDRIVRLLFGIAALTAVLGVAYAWYTSPRRRVKVAERRAALASQRLDDAVAASFVGTTIALDRDGESTSGDPSVVDDDVLGDDDGDDASREGLASKLFPRREDDADDPERPNPRPDPRPRPNDSPWET